MGKNKQHAKRLGAIGPDRLSKYARKVQQRQEQTWEPTPVQASVAPKPHSNQRIIATIPYFSTSQGFAFARAEDGRQLYVPMGVIRGTKLNLRSGSRIECETVQDPDKKFPRVTNIYASIPRRG